jgi:hypothetical protein
MTVTTNTDSTGTVPTPAGFPGQIKVIDAIDFELLRALTVSVPLLSKRQAILYLKQLGQVGTEPRDRLEQLRVAGWIQKFRCISSGPLPPAGPRVAWQPGDPLPLLSHHRKRARQQDEIVGPRDIEFYVASRFTANLFGVPYRSASSNDVVSKWWLCACLFRQLIDERVEITFTSERDTVSSATDSGKLPEHLKVTTQDGSQQIHCPLFYSSLLQLVSLHCHCKERSLPYYLW